MDRKFDIRCLRRRMGWTSSDLARRLGVKVAEVELWEQGSTPDDHDVLSRLEFLFHQAELCSDEVKSGPLAEDLLDRESLDQVGTDRLKENENI